MVVSCFRDSSFLLRGNDIVILMEPISFDPPSLSLSLYVVRAHFMRKKKPMSSVSESAHTVAICHARLMRVLVIQPLYQLTNPSICSSYPKWKVFESGVWLTDSQ